MKNRTAEDIARRLGARPLGDMSGLPHEVDCHGLDRAIMGDEGFEEALQERGAWNRQNCEGRYDAEPLTNAHGEKIGRKFRFENANDAFHFRMRF